MPCGKKRKRHKIATHKRKKRLRKNSHKKNIVLLEDKHLTELHQERFNNQFSVGDIYLGRIKKVMPGLNAAFIDVGHEKDAFLH